MCGWNVLLVDDDALLAKGTAKLIQRLGGHQVVIADEPAAIVSCCRSQPTDIVLMDVNLPGAEWEGQAISGADLARFLKNHPETSHLPIILVTAYAMLNEREGLLKRSQADALCVKPITNYQALLELIDRLCKGGQLQDEGGGE
ncbi:MAG: response regulator [Tildeniella nuda ZEHNDER 1965/U140]|jgi:CheY-like chemotaxis protein|nr:response regulator [Tildeniella nuda ZEHNDER 1965/U140]